ncbi:MAG TPA: dihydroorotase [Bacteroidales bacterium]|nr:dihydroorotase [Bacteroidales bacterium]
MKKLIHRAVIVNERKKFRGSVLIENDRIKSIYTLDENFTIPNGTDIIEADGMLLLPGIIDDQVHFREPGLTHKADINSETRAAVAGGVTSIMEMPNTIPQTITHENLKEKQRIAEETSLCNYSFYFGATNDNIEEIRKIDPLTTCGVKVFMGASTGNMLVDNMDSLRMIFAESTVPVACHCEDEPTIQANLKKYKDKYGDNIPVDLHPQIRSHEACLKSSSLAVRLAGEFNTRLHILHLSTADEMQLFDNSIPLNEKRITAEVCVHHLWFDDKDYENKGTLIKWNPAIKTANDRRALIESINNDRIDIIATDHAPHTFEEKQNPYTMAPSGGPLVQHSLVAMMELSKEGKINIEKIVEKMCHNPAIVFNIEERGFIREGYKADLCLVNPDNNWKVTKTNILYRCKWSPFEGQSFSSSVEKTFVNGEMAYDRGRINDNLRGRLLTFKR